MHIHLLTLFPGLFAGFLSESIIRIAQDKGALQVNLVDFRQFATDRHACVDDRPYGGGPGMLLKPEPIFAAVESLEQERGPMHRVMLTPTGKRLTQSTVRRLASLPEMMMLCGRYEGFDERIRLGLQWEEISIGDYVLSGGEVPAMVLVDAIARLQPDVLGHPESAMRDSFEKEDLLDHPQYTRPRDFRGMSVPEILLSGNHAEIEAWRNKLAIELSEQRFGEPQSKTKGSAESEPNE